MARIDFLLQPIVAGEATSPPGSIVPGDCFIVGDGATAEYAGREGAIANWDGQQWSFAAPIEGMLVFDKSVGVHLRFDGQWSAAARPSLPSGGSTIDTEARQAISELLDVLKSFGIFS